MSRTQHRLPGITPNRHGIVSFSNFAYLLATMLVLAMIVQGRRYQARDDTPIGKLTREEAIRRATPILRMLTDDRSERTVEADHAESVLSDSRRMLRWTVLSYGPDETEDAVVTLDAESGRLICAARIVEDPKIATI